MTPTSFEFTVTLPGNTRLVSVIKGLVTQASNYAQLSADAGATLASEVERAADASMTAAEAQGSPVEFKFSADEEALTIRISSEAATKAVPRASVGEGISVEWSKNGSRQICQIRQPIP